MCLSDGDHSLAACLTKLLSLGKYHSWDVTCFKSHAMDLDFDFIPARSSLPQFVSPLSRIYVLLAQAKHSVSPQ